MAGFAGCLPTSGPMRAGGEAIHGESLATSEKMRQAVFEYIEVDYNRARRHSAIGYISPMVFEALQHA